MDRKNIPAIFENIINLGATIKTYHQTALSKILNVAMSAILLLGSIYIIFYGLIEYPKIFPNVAAENSPLIIGFGVILLAGALYWIYTIINKWNYFAIEYANGFAFSNGRKVIPLKWEEIESITMDITKISYYGIIPIGKQQKYKIKGTSNIVFDIDGTLSHVEDLIGTIRNKTSPIIMERYGILIEKGEKVICGKLEISKTEGIKKGTTVIKWNEIKNINIQDGALTITPQKGELFGKISERVKNIPNIEPFLGTVNKMREQK